MEHPRTDSERKRIEEIGGGSMKSAKIYTNDLNRLIAATKSFVSDSDHRPCNQYIKFEFHAADNQVVAMAVDGYRMSVEHSVISDCDEDFVAFVKSNTKLPSKQYATISLTDDGKEAVIRCCGFSFGYTQPKDSGFASGSRLDFEAMEAYIHGGGSATSGGGA